MSENANVQTTATPQSAAQPPVQTAQTVTPPAAPEQPTQNGADPGVEDFTAAYDPKPKLEGQADNPQNPETSNQQEQQPEQQKSNVPEHYELKDSEGKALEANLAAQYSESFKKLGLTQEQAQQAYEIYKSNQDAWMGQLESQFAEQKKTWLNEIKTDAEMGGQNYANTKMNIGRVMEKFGTPELRKYLNETGIGINPHFVRFMSKLGAAMGNDTLKVEGKAPTEEEYRASLLKFYDKSPDLR